MFLPNNSLCVVIFCYFLAIVLTYIAIKNITIVKTKRGKNAEFNLRNNKITCISMLGALLTVLLGIWPLLISVFILILLIAWAFLIYLRAHFRTRSNIKT